MFIGAKVAVEAARRRRRGNNNRSKDLIPKTKTHRRSLPICLIWFPIQRKKRQNKGRSLPIRAFVNVKVATVTARRRGEVEGLKL